MTRTRIAIVIHGPEAVDSGLALRVIDLLGADADVRAKMSGFTGVAAVKDAGLEELIDISRHHVPSTTLVEESARSDVLLFINYGKTRRSATRLGEMVHARIMDRTSKPLIQVDDGFIIMWQGVSEVFDLIADQLGLEKLPPSKGGAELEGSWRRVHGVLPGENVWVNGVVVGKATSDRVRIACTPEGSIIAEGLEFKQTGIARLGRFNLRTAKIRSGVTRRTKSAPRIDRPEGSEGIFFIDHAAESAIYRCRRARFVVTVGDDTSRAAGSVLSRFGVPVLAITDGDEDGIVQDRTLAPGSIVFKLKPGNDDIVGARVLEEVFDGLDHYQGDMTIDRVADRIRELAAAVLESEERTS